MYLQPTADEISAASESVNCRSAAEICWEVDKNSIDCFQGDRAITSNDLVHFTEMSEKGVCSPLAHLY